MALSFSGRFQGHDAYSFILFQGQVLVLQPTSPLDAALRNVFAVYPRDLNRRRSG